MLATVVALFALQAGVARPSQSISEPPAESRPTTRSAPGRPVAHTRAGRHGIEINGNLIGTSEAGVNASVGLVGRHVTLAAGGGYRMVGEFEQPIGGRTRFSGTEITLGMGVLFGRGR